MRRMGEIGIDENSNRYERVDRNACERRGVE
jgi:hypothetical protein